VPQEPAEPPGLKVLDALSASGLRAFRYTLEIEGIASVMANDLDSTAVEAIKQNCVLNNILEGRVIPNQGDASLVCYLHRDDAARFDVLDLDPYGAPTPFLDGAVQAVSEGGLLCVTATDMAVLCGKNSEVCHSKYGVMSLRGLSSCHEFAIRGVLAAIESAANRYRRHIVPVLSFQTDFYLRVFVRVFTSPSMVKRSPNKIGHVYVCHGCEAMHVQRVGKIHQKGSQVKYSAATAPPMDQFCAECGSKFNMGGPIWCEPMVEPEFLASVVQHLQENRERYGSYDRLHGMLAALASELHDVPLYYSIHAMCKVLHCSCPPIAGVRSAIQAAGYQVSQAHTEPLALKTDAPPNVLWDILRCWVKSNPIKIPKENTPAFRILSKEPVLQADFSIRPGTKSGSKQTGPMFVPAPEPNWGPKARASGKRKHQAEESVPNHNRVE